ncbi:MAG: hypothetical protein ACJ71B_10985 [Nitrososphaera sp.]
MASFSRRVSSKTVDTIKGIIADATIVLSINGKEDALNIEVRERE